MFLSFPDVFFIIINILYSPHFYQLIFFSFPLRHVDNNVSSTYVVYDQKWKMCFSGLLKFALLEKNIKIQLQRVFLLI